MDTLLHRMFFGAVILGLAACAEAPRQFLDARPLPTAEQIAAFGETGIAAGEKVEPRTPVAPESLSIEAKVGAPLGMGAGGAGLGAIVGLGCGPGAFICVPALAAAGGFAGLLGGAAATIAYGSPEAVNSASVTLKNALDSSAIEKSLTRMVATETFAATGRGLLDAEYRAGSDAWQRSDGRAVDTLLVLQVTRFELVQLGQSQRNPDLRLEINVAGDLYGRGRTVPVFERRWVYDSEVHSYFEWAENQGVLVTSEIDRAVKVLGKQIVSDFLTPQPRAPAAMDASAPVNGDSLDGREKNSADTGSATSEDGAENSIGRMFFRAGVWLKELFGPDPADPD